MKFNIKPDGLKDTFCCLKHFIPLCLLRLYDCTHLGRLLCNHLGLSRPITVLPVA